MTRRPSWRLLRSTTARLFLPLVASQLISTGVILAFAWVAGQQAIDREHRAQTRELRDDLMADYAEGGTSQLRETISDRIAREGRAAPLILLVDGAGRPLAGNLSKWPREAADHSGIIEARLSAEETGRIETAVFSSTRLGHNERLLAGWAFGKDEYLARSYERALIAALLLAIPLAGMVGVLVSRLYGTRLRALAATAHRVSSGSLDARVTLDGSGDGFDRLGQEINLMLQRIETLVGELRVVTDGLAHDLRSPLTRLRSALERAALAETQQVGHAAIERALAEADALLAMLSTALQISRTEAGIGRDRFAATNLADLFNEIAEIYGPIAEDEGLRIEVDAAPYLVRQVNRELVAQAIGNLVDNALKYAEGGRVIRLSAREAGEAVQLSVCDDGVGIRPDQMEDARRRFTRLDPARGVVGSGLGLALVEAVAKLHGGTMSLSAGEPGLCVTLELPAAN